MSQKMIDINGKKYVTVKLVSDIWDCSQTTVRNYCKSGKIEGAFKDTSGRWLIPADCRRPLNDNQIKNLLIFIVASQNDLQDEFDYKDANVNSENIKNVYQQLADLGYVKHFKIRKNQNILHNIKLTNKGLEFIVKSRSNNESDRIKKAVIEWAPIIVKFGIEISTLINEVII